MAGRSAAPAKEGYRSREAPPLRPGAGDAAAAYGPFLAELLAPRAAAAEPEDGP